MLDTEKKPREYWDGYHLGWEHGESYAKMVIFEQQKEIEALKTQIRQIEANNVCD